MALFFPGTITALIAQAVNGYSILVDSFNKHFRSSDGDPQKCELENGLLLITNAWASVKFF